MKPLLATMALVTILGVVCAAAEQVALAQAPEPPPLAAGPFYGQRDPNEPGVAKRYKTLIPALLQALKDSDKQVVQAAATALGNIGPDAVPALVRTLQGDDRTLRAHAALALGKMGPRGQEAIPALLKLLQDPDVEVRREVARALAAILQEPLYSVVPATPPPTLPPAP